MYELSYIVHIVGVALWLGSFLGFGYLLRGVAKGTGNLETFTPVVRKIQKWVMFGVIPSLVLIMSSGSYMIFQFNRDTMPLYLSLMEQAGSLVILLTIILVSIFSVRLTKKLKGMPSKKERTLAVLTKAYANFLLVSAVLGVVIVVIVGLRLV